MTHYRVLAKEERVFFFFSLIALRVHGSFWGRVWLEVSPVFSLAFRKCGLDPLHVLATSLANLDALLLGHGPGVFVERPLGGQGSAEGEALDGVQFSLSHAALEAFGLAPLGQVQRRRLLRREQLGGAARQPSSAGEPLEAPAPPRVGRLVRQREREEQVEQAPHFLDRQVRVVVGRRLHGCRQE